MKTQHEIAMINTTGQLSTTVRNTTPQMDTQQKTGARNSFSATNEMEQQTKESLLRPPGFCIKGRFVSLRLVSFQCNSCKNKLM